MSQCPGPLTVAPPPADPYTGGLFSAATFPDTPGSPHWQCGVQYPVNNCADPSVWTEVCPPEVPADKDQTLQFPWTGGDAFTVYLGIDCNLPGSTLDEYATRLRSTLQNCGQKAVERAFWTGEKGNRPRLADPACTVLSDEPLTILGGIAALESYLGEHYCGTGVIHAPRGVAPYAASHQQLCGNCTGPQRTSLGTRWAFGGGYYVNTGPDGAEAPEGTAWLYATGQVSIWRSEIFIPNDVLEQAFNTRTNEVDLFAEQTYVVAYECTCAAVPVEIGCSC